MKPETSSKTNPVLERLAVFSDTHGNRDTMKSALRLTGPYTRIIHLGDGVLNGKEVAKDLQMPFTGIMGNEDYGEIFPHSFAAVDIFNDRFSVTLMKRADNDTWQSNGKEVKASREPKAP